MYECRKTNKRKARGKKGRGLTLRGIGGGGEMEKKK